MVERVHSPIACLTIRFQARDILFLIAGRFSEKEHNITMDSEDTYTQLITFLEQHEVPYRLIDHAPEGRTENVSPMRGNKLSQAAKCIVLMVKIGKKVTKYILAVVPGDARVDLQAIKTMMQGTYVAFASSDIAERLAGSVAGTILPFSFNSELELVVDPSLLENDEIYFNAARLDRSMALKTSDYVAVARPRLQRIVTVQEAVSPSD